MKKLILIPSLVATVGIPFISMVGCVGIDEPYPWETKFETSIGKMSSPTTATFQLGWTNGHKLTFANDWKFVTGSTTIKSITATGGHTRPQTIFISFDSEITQNDIKDGKLTFTYSDSTADEDNVSMTIENICISKFVWKEPKYDEEVILTYVPETEFDWENLVGPRGFVYPKTYKVVADFSKWVHIKQTVFIFFLTSGSKIAAHAPKTISVVDIINEKGERLSPTTPELVWKIKYTYAVSPDTDWIWFNYDIKQTSVINFYVTVTEKIQEFYEFAVYDQDWWDE